MENRDNVVKVYFTHDELEIIKNNAQKQGLKLSPYLRQKGLFKVSFTSTRFQNISMKRIQEEIIWSEVKTTQYHGGQESKEKVDQHEKFMQNCMNDPEFQEKMKSQKKKVERAILLQNRQIPKGVDYN